MSIRKKGIFLPLLVAFTFFFSFLFTDYKLSHAIGEAGAIVNNTVNFNYTTYPYSFGSYQGNGNFTLNNIDDDKKYAVYLGSDYLIYIIGESSFNCTYSYYSELGSSNNQTAYTGSQSYDSDNRPYVMVDGVKFLNCFYTTFGNSIYTLTIDNGSFPYFTDINACLNYFNNNDLSGADYSPVPSVSYDGDNLYLKEYNFLFVDSSRLKDMYCTFEYSFPDSLDLTDVYIDVDTSYDLIMEPNLLSSLLDPRKFHEAVISELQFTPTKDSSLGLGAGKNSFRINISDVQSIKNYKSNQSWLTALLYDSRKEERDILGNKNIILSLLNDGVSADYRTTKSQLVFKLTVCKGSTRGKSYYLSCDLLGNGTFIHSTTPDQNGNEKSDSDIKYTGKYFNDPKDDNFGNTLNNYSYVPPDIDIAVNVDSTTGQPTVNTNENNIIFPSDLNIKFHDDDLYYDISPDDYNGVIDNLTNLTDFSEDNKETYGFLHDIYAALPTPLVILMASGLSGIILVSFIKILRG